jgi:3',5'-cyclic AMP phosphodiesterase CpdA
MKRLAPTLLAISLAAPVAVACQQPAAAAAQPEPVIAIAPPRRPIPMESVSAGVNRFSFIVYGDTRGRRDGTEVQYEHRMVVDAMVTAIQRADTTASPIKFVLQSGDAVVNGRDPKQWNASFVSLINRITTDAGIPYFLAPGNHDVTSAPVVDNANRRIGLANYLQAMSQLIPADNATRRLNGYPTYAFGYGNTFVLALDSNIADDSVQLRWATSQLEGIDKARYVNIVAFFHHPAFSSGPHGGAIIEHPTVMVRQHWMPLFRKHGVKLIATGHEHLFEHWVERYRGADGKRRRMDQLVSGGGGAPLYPFQGYPDVRPYMAASGIDSARVQNLVAPGVDRGDNPYHFVIVHVNGERLSIEIRAVDWGTGYAPYRSNRAVLSDSVP